MKSQKAKILKGIFFFAFLISTIQLKAQSYPSYYSASPSHAAYATGSSMNSNADYINGFCFAYDAVSPLGQGYTGPVYVYTVIPGSWTGGPNSNYAIAMQFVAITLPSTADWYTNAESVRSYGNSILALDPTNSSNISAKNFWDGYAELIEWASYNPYILLLTPGNQM